MNDKKVSEIICVEALHKKAISTRDFLCGVEYEIENIYVNKEHPIFSQYPGIKVTEDGSLRNYNNSYGTEIIMPPMTYTEALLSFNKIHEALVQMHPGFPQHSERTSTHIHVNVSQLTVKEFQNLVLLYTLLEPAFFDYVGNKRKQNIHCVPLFETALSSSYWKGLEHIGDWLAKWSKYAAFNLCPVNKQGTVEFRHLHGSNDYNVFKGWLKMIHALYTFVTSEQHKNFSLKAYLSSGGEVSGLFTEIMGLECPLKEVDFHRCKMDVKLAFISPKSF